MTRADIQCLKTFHLRCMRDILSVATWDKIRTVDNIKAADEEAVFRPEFSECWLDIRCLKECAVLERGLHDLLLFVTRHRYSHHSSNR